MKLFFVTLFAVTVSLFVFSCGGDSSENDNENVTDSFESSDDENAIDQESQDENQNDDQGEIWSDPDTGYKWSPVSKENLNWESAKEYCLNLSTEGLSWKLPSISELRTLVRNCPNSETGGACGITDSCAGSSECLGVDVCEGCSETEGEKSKTGDMGWFWSSSEDADITAYGWLIDFSYANISYSAKTMKYQIRCVSTE